MFKRNLSNETPLIKSGPLVSKIRWRNHPKTRFFFFRKGFFFHCTHLLVGKKLGSKESAQIF